MSETTTDASSGQLSHTHDARLFLAFMRWSLRSVLLLLFAFAAAYVAFTFSRGHMEAKMVAALAAAAAIIATAGGVVAFIAAAPRTQLASDLCGWVSVFVFASFLAWDPATGVNLHPLGPPIPAEAEAAQKTWMRGCKGGESDTWPELFGAKSPLAAKSPQAKSGNYAELLRTEADEVHLAWDKSAVAREWIATVNSHAVVSDFITDFHSPTLNFQKLRGVTNAICHRAALLALMGDGDGALATLLPLAEFSKQLRHGSRSLISIMMCTVTEGKVHEYTRFILLQATPTAEALEILAAALDDAIDDGRDLTRCLLLEADMGRNAMEGASSSEFTESILDDFVGGNGAGVLKNRLVAGLFFNRHAFVAMHRETMSSIALAARHGDPTVIAGIQAAFTAQQARPHLKNPVGFVMLETLVPTFGKLIETYHKRLEERRALVSDLRKAD